MDIKTILEKEYKFLKQKPSISNYVMISTTAKHAPKFIVQPRRVYTGFALSSFMINDESLLCETLKYFDGKVDGFYIDIEQKQDINLFKLSQKIIKESKLF